MKTLGVILFAVVIGQLAVGSRAWAGQPTAPQAPYPAPQAPYPAPPIDPYSAPPPTYGSAPPAYAPGQLSAAQSFMMYESQRKSAGLAIVLEVFVPGLGSLYGDHGVGSLITWALMLAGIGMVIYGASQVIEDSRDPNMSRSNNGGAGTFGLTAGIALMLGGRIYGLVDSYMSTDEYNRKLKAKYGLPVVVNFGLGKVGSGSALSFGPRLSVAF